MSGWTFRHTVVAAVDPADAWAFWKARITQSVHSSGEAAADMMAGAEQLAVGIPQGMQKLVEAFERSKRSAG